MYFPSLFSCCSTIISRDSLINTKVFSMVSFCSLKTERWQKVNAVIYNIQQRRKAYNVAFKQNCRKQKLETCFKCGLPGPRVDDRTNNKETVKKVDILMEIINMIINNDNNNFASDEALFWYTVHENDSKWFVQIFG